jgi:hypothetical protein
VVIRSWSVLVGCLEILESLDCRVLVVRIFGLGGQIMIDKKKEIMYMKETEKESTSAVQ